MRPEVCQLFRRNKIDRIKAALIKVPCKRERDKTDVCDHVVKSICLPIAVFQVNITFGELENDVSDVMNEYDEYSDFVISSFNAQNISQSNISILFCCSLTHFFSARGN